MVSGSDPAVHVAASLGSPSWCLNRDHTGAGQYLLHLLQLMEDLGVGVPVDAGLLCCSRALQQELLQILGTDHHLLRSRHACIPQGSLGRQPACSHNAIYEAVHVAPTHHI